MYRLIPLETRSAAMNMALDEACMNSIREGASPPTIRLYRWKPSSITIGYFQCLADEVDLQACREENIPIVRRQTGGGAVYHDAQGEVTYSIICPEELMPKNIIESYEAVIANVIKALANIGINAAFRPINDLTVEGRKIGGSAQTRRDGVFLQHGTILLSVDAEKMFRLLTPDKSKVSDKPFIKSVNAAVTSVQEHSQASREAVEAALRKTFSEQFQASPGKWSEEELSLADSLAREKYSSQEWNAMR